MTVGVQGAKKATKGPKGPKGPKKGPKKKAVSHKSHERWKVFNELCGWWSGAAPRQLVSFTIRDKGRGTVYVMVDNEAQKVTQIVACWTYEHTDISDQAGDYYYVKTNYPGGTAQVKGTWTEDELFAAVIEALKRDKYPDKSDGARHPLTERGDYQQLFLRMYYHDTSKETSDLMDKITARCKEMLADLVAEAEQSQREAAAEGDWEPEY